MSLNVGEGISGSILEAIVFRDLLPPQTGRTGDLWCDISLGPPVWKKCTSISPYTWVSIEGGGGGAPVDATYLVLSTNATLSDERVFTPAGGIAVTDGGAGGNYTVAGINVAAGTQTGAPGSTIMFSNSNGISFGMNASSVVTASVAGAGAAGSISAGTTRMALGEAVFSDSNGISFGLNVSTVTASHNALTSQTNQQMTLFATGNTTQSSTGTTNASSIIFRGEGFVSVGITGGSVVVSGTQTNPVVSNAIQSVGSATGSGTNTSRFAADDHVHAGVFSMGVSTGGNTAGNTRVDVGRFVLAGGANITLSQATAAGALNTVSIAAPTQTNQQMTMFATGNTTQSSTGTTNASSIIYRGDGFVSVGITGGSVVISGTQTNPVVSNAIQSVGSATGSGTNTSRFAADDHVHAGVFSMGVSTAGNTLGDTRVDVGRFVLQGGANITLSQITAAGALNTVVFSGGAGGGGITNIRVSAGTTSNLLSDITFSDANGISFGINASTITASVATSLTNFRLSAGTTSNLRSDFTFGDANNVSFGLNAGTITASVVGNPVVSNAIQSVGSATGSGTNTSRFAADDHVHAGVFSMGVSTGGNTAGDTRVDVGRFVIAGGAGIIASQATAAGALNTVSMVNSWSTATTVSGVTSANVVGANAGRFALEGHQHAGLHNISFVGNTSGTTSQGNGSIVFGGGPNITLSGSTAAGGMTISISGGAGGGGGFSAGASNLGNTAGSTGVTGTRLVFVGTGPVSLSQSTDANGGTLSINAPATSSLVGTSGITLSSAGSTISVQAVPQSFAAPFGYGLNAIVATQIGNASVMFFPMELPQNLVFDRVIAPLSISVSSSSNSSHGGTLSFAVGIYTLNGSTLSSLASALRTQAWTNTSNNSLTALSGIRQLSIPLTTTLSAGRYWLGIWSRTSTVNANWATISNLGISVGTAGSAAFLGHFASASATSGQYMLGLGSHSATSTALHASAALTHIQGTAAGIQRFPGPVYFVSNTV